MPESSPGASGDIALAILRRQGAIGVPVYLWTSAGWVDFAALTPVQFSAWVDLRPTLYPPGDFSATPKTESLTISRTNNW